MVKYSKFVFLFLFTSVFSSNYAQNIKLEIVGSPEKAVLFQLEGENANMIDSVISQNDSFKFNLDGKHNGFYRLQFDNKHRLDFINDGKDIEISSDYKNIQENLEVIHSESNKLYYEFIKIKNLRGFRNLGGLIF